MEVIEIIITNIITLLCNWATQTPDKIAPKYYNMDSKSYVLIVLTVI